MRVTQVNSGRLRELRGLKSREVVAHQLRSRGHATDAKTIWRWETGRNTPNSRVLPDLAEVLGAGSVDELYGDSDDDEESDAMADLVKSIRALVREEVRSAA